MASDSVRSGPTNLHLSERVTHLHIAVPTKTRFYASRIHVLKSVTDIASPRAACTKNLKESGSQPKRHIGGVYTGKIVWIVRN